MHQHDLDFGAERSKAALHRIDAMRAAGHERQPLPHEFGEPFGWPVGERRRQHDDDVRDVGVRCEGAQRAQQHGDAEDRAELLRLARSGADA